MDHAYAARGTDSGTAGEQAQHPPDDGRRVEEAGDGRAGGGVFRQVGGVEIGRAHV